MPSGHTVISFPGQRRGLALWALATLAIAMLATPAAAQTFPPLSGRVVDAAEIIPDDREAALTEKLAAVEADTSRQFVIATVPSLEGYDIADYGYRLGRAWGIGQKDANNGLILLVAPNDRKVRIEVGYGLEPIMTDALSSVIINTQIVPRFRDGDFPGGIEAGADAIIEQLKLPPEEAEKRAAAASESRRGGEGIDPAVIFWLIVLFFFVLPTVMAAFGRKGKRYRRRSGIGPVVIWGPGWGSGSSGGSWGGGGGGFSGGGGSFGGGGASGGW